MTRDAGVPVGPVRPALREWISAGLATIVVVGSILMIAFAYSHIGDSETFTRAKDLLLFINPILGVVIGYYFNRATSEARAEHAERTAEAAQTQVREADAERAKAKAALWAVRAAAEEVAREGDTRLASRLQSVLRSTENE
jgi:phosphate/sulfate permease